MGSAGADRFGLASAINSTLSRLSSVLAVAIVGAITLIGFTASIEHRAEAQAFEPDVRRALIAEAAKLGDAEPPAGLSPPVQELARRTIRLAFLDAFRAVTWVGAALAASAVLVAFSIPAGPLPSGPRRS